MILTVSLNPAIDKTCKIQTLIPGQVNRLDETVEYPGGKGINVTRILRQLKTKVTACGFAGGYNGEFIRRAVVASGADDGFTIINENTRVNTNIIGTDGYVTELLDPGPVIDKDEQYRFMKDYEKLLDKAKIVVISGSLPRGIGVFYYNELVEKANAKGIKVIVDTSMYPLKNVISSKPFMIKPNIKEMEFLVGKKLDTHEKLIEASRDIISQGVSYVVISLGSKGFLHVDKDNAYFVNPLSLEVVNTVGCGDALVAAFAHGIYEGFELEKTLKIAGAVASSNATTPESGHIDMDRYNEFLDKIEINRVE